MTVHKPKFFVSPVMLGGMVARLAMEFKPLDALLPADREQELTVLRVPIEMPVSPIFKPGLVTPAGEEIKAQSQHYREYRRQVVEFLGVPFRVWQELP